MSPLKKKTVRLPPADVLRSADPAIRYILETQVDTQHTLNEIIDSNNGQSATMEKGFTKANDRLNLINGRVGKNELQVEQLRIEKIEREKAEALKIQTQKEAAKTIAEALALRKQEDIEYRKRVFGYLKWIVSLLVAGFGPFLFDWIWHSPPVLIGFLMIQVALVAALLGIYYGRRPKNNLPSTELPKET